MSELKSLRNKARKLHRKALALKKAYQAAMSEHADWLHAYPARWEARVNNNFSVEESLKHKEFEAKVESLKAAAGEAKAEWFLARNAADEVELAK